MGPVVGLLLLSLALGWFVRRCWMPQADVTGRVVDFAWTALVPKLQSNGFSLEDSAFVAGLALASVGRGRSGVRAKSLERMGKATEKAVAAGAVRHLGALRRLAIADAATAAQEDAALLLAGEVGQCLDGKLPIAFAEGLLSQLDAAWWTPGERARLRVLACDRAFEAGFEVANLRELGQASPALDDLLQSENEQELAALRLLWSMRARCPWERCGHALLVFELAAEPEYGQLLQKYPDLLLYQKTGPGARDAESEDLAVAVILMVGRGIVFQDMLFTGMPRNIEIVKRKDPVQGYELVLDKARFWFVREPGALLARLERWFRFYFKDFLPQMAEVHQWQSPHVAAALQAQQMVTCPECRRVLLTRVGEVGVLLRQG